MYAILLISNFILTMWKISTNKRTFRSKLQKRIGPYFVNANPPGLLFINLARWVSCLVSGIWFARFENPANQNQRRVSHLALSYDANSTLDSCLLSSVSECTVKHLSRKPSHLFFIVKHPLGECPIEEKKNVQWQTHDYPTELDPLRECPCYKVLLVPPKVVSSCLAIVTLNQTWTQGERTKIILSNTEQHYAFKCHGGQVHQTLKQRRHVPCAMVQRKVTLLGIPMKCT